MIYNREWIPWRLWKSSFDRTTVMFAIYLYRQDCAKRKLPVLNLLTGWKSGFSPRRGHSLHRFMWTGTWVCLAVQNFTSIGTRGGGCGPEINKFPLIGKESPRRDEPFDRFLEFYGLLYVQLSYISVSNLTWFAPQVMELLLRNRASVI